MSLNRKIEAALNQQIQSEFYSSYVYLSMSGYRWKKKRPSRTSWRNSP